MAKSNDENDLRRANFRLCLLCIWPSYGGFGFNIVASPTPPHIIRTIESNSPAAASGLRILDLVLAVNNQDVSKADYKTVTQAIRNARDSNNRVELLVIEKRFYEPLKKQGISFDSRLAKVTETPTTMPLDYMNFPKYTPRICEIRLNNSDQTFGFEVINGIQDTGAFIQEIVPNSPASKTTLRKCDRILEIDDKFVDKDQSKTVLEKLFEAKNKRMVKLYVVDTNTYKHFQENNIPLPSKDFQKSNFAKQHPPISTYINVEDISTEYRSRDVDITRSTFPDNRPSQRSANLTTGQPHQDDIRLCTINRANATDTYGIELNYHRRDQYHTLKLTPFVPSNAALAGVKSNDHLIEVNGENIERIGDENVQQRIRAIKYPQTLRILVADSATYNYYKQQNKVIHSGLPTVKKLPESTTGQYPSLSSSTQEPSVKAIVTSVPPPREQPSTVIAGLVNNNPAQSGISKESSQNNRRQHKLQRIPGFRGYGFSVNSNQAGNIAHKITQIAPDSPAAQQGLRVGDYIIAVNNQNVEKMNANDFNQFLRTSAQNADTYGNPLLLEVINENSYQSSTLPNNFSTKYTPTDVIVVNESSYSRPTEPTPSRGLGRKSAATATTQRTSSQSGSQKSITSSSASSRHESGKLTTTTTTQPITSGDQPQQLTKIQPITSGDQPQQLTKIQPITSGDEPQKLSTTQPTISRDESRKSSIIQPIIPQNESRKPSVIQPTTPRDERRKSSTIQPIPYQNGSLELAATQLTYNQPYLNGYDSSPHDRYARLEKKPYEAASSSSLYHSHGRLSRGTVDVVSKNRLLRYCRLNTRPGQTFGFQLKSDDDKHMVYNIQPDSPAAQAGLNENDCLIEIDNENVEQKSNKEVDRLIRNGTYNGTLRLFISPNSVKVLSKRSSKSLSRINGDHYYRDEVPRLRYNDQDQSSTTSRNRWSNDYSSEPTEPLPRKCVLQRDPSFGGCGFRLIEKENYDTPIITEISPNSPAKRSGLTEGDHIIYIDSQNVQNFRSFNDIIHLIQRIFEENGQLTLITLTGPGYQVLKRRGGYLESSAFDYQSSTINQLKPRLCKLKLYNNEYDFGFTLNYNEFFYVKSVDQGSSADIYGLKKDDIVLELNGKIAKYLTINQIKEITEISKQERKLDILVIDIDGYRYSIKHAIPLNSLLSFVQTKEGRVAMTNNRIQHEPIYL